MTNKDDFVIAPKPVTRWQSSDERTHETELDAIAHETFLAVKGDLGEFRLDDRFGDAGRAHLAYGIIVELAKKYQFTLRSAS